MIRYLVSAGFLVSYTGLPLQAGTPVSTQPTTHVSTTAHAEDKVAKTTDKTIAKSSTSASVPSSKSSPHSIIASSETTMKTTDKTVAKTSTLASGPCVKSSTHFTTVSSGVSKSASTLPSKTSADSENRYHSPSGSRLARVTAYWASEGDYYTSLGISSTGIHLHDGYCAVDPSIIPYGSVVTISGLGKYLAVDTGSAVVSRTAARETGHTSEERAALVIDLYFESSRDGENFAATGPKFASITWQAPNSANSMSSDARSMVVEADWNKLRNKQLSE